MKKKYPVYYYAVCLITILFFQCTGGAKKDLQQYKTGLILATPSQYKRIKEAEVPAGAGAQSLPSAIDFSADMPEVGNQRNQMSCVAWATAYAFKSFAEKREGNGSIRFSPSYVYNQINNGVDMGSRFEDALQLLSQQGAGLWDDMPYNETDFTSKPSDIARQKAKPYSIYNWARVNTADMKEVKMQLAAGYPVLIAANIDNGFRAGRKNGTDEFVWRRASGDPPNAHAMIVVGYNDDRNAFKVMNSWGTDWGNNGYCWIDYQFFEDVVQEGYIAKDQLTRTNPDTNNNDDTNNNTNNNNNNTVDTKTIDNTTVDPTQYAKADLRGVQVQHNVTHPTFGNCMKISGYIDIPAGSGKTFQLSNHFYYYNTTTQVPSLQSPQFADVNGYAATGTILYSVPPQGLNNWYFEAFMPYSAFNIQQGSYVNGTYKYERTNMYAIPTLFIDNFAYAKGEAISFYVDK